MHIDIHTCLPWKTQVGLPQGFSWWVAGQGGLAFTEGQKGMWGLERDVAVFMSSPSASREDFRSFGFSGGRKKMMLRPMCSEPLMAE